MTLERVVDWLAIGVLVVVTVGSVIAREYPTMVVAWIR